MRTATALRSVWRSARMASYAIRPLRRRRTTRRLKVLQVLSHRADARAARVHQPIRLPRILGRHQRVGATGNLAPESLNAAALQREGLIREIRHPLRIADKSLGLSTVYKARCRSVPRPWTRAGGEDHWPSQHRAARQYPTPLRPPRGPDPAATSSAWRNTRRPTQQYLPKPPKPQQPPETRRLRHH